MATSKKAERPRGVLVLGEVLCDLFPPKSGVPFVKAASLVPRLGGAPANVAVQVARMGVRSGLVSALGTDPLGDRMLAELKGEGVEVGHVQRRASHRTGVTLVEVDGDGERRFYPLVERRSDLSLCEADVVPAYVRSFAVVHTGTVTLRAASSRAAQQRFVSEARAAGRLVSLDVNLRWGMYATRDELLRRARAALKTADVVKATREEALALLGASARVSNAKLVERLLAAGPRLVFLTLDAAGAVVANGRASLSVPSPKVKVVDATGAGDAFLGVALAKLAELRATPEAVDAGALAELGHAACRAGAACCTALGATTAMPRR
ncbi:MAG: carbohydrate kinase [Myxococcaceae bacterium]|nr:carbohydrate kinase [Myxococcaceae bacterium]